MTSATCCCAALHWSLWSLFITRSARSGVVCAPLQAEAKEAYRQAMLEKQERMRQKMLAKKKKLRPASAPMGAAGPSLGGAAAA